MTAAQFADIIERTTANGNAALVCLALGWGVVPWQYDATGSKAPTRPWRRNGARPLSDRDEVIDHWSVQPYDLAGVMTGPESRIFVLDVDPRNGGAESLVRLQNDHGALPVTFTVRTPSGGWHLYLAYPPLDDGVEIVNAAPLDGYPGLDVRGWGGFVAAPGAVTERGRYEPPSDAVELADAPGWLVSLASGTPGSHGGEWTETGDYVDEPLSASVEQLIEGAAAVPGGEQEPYLFRLLSVLRAQNRSPEEMARLGWAAAARFQRTRTEPWTEADVRAKVEHVVSSYPPGASVEPETMEWVGQMSQVMTTPPEPSTEPPAAMERIIVQKMIEEHATREARRRVDANELAEARGPRPKRTARDYAKVEPPAAVLSSKLAAEVNLLAGPTEAGKSLKVRDWALEIGASGRNVVVVLSEGTHDFEQRWTTQPLWDAAADHVFVLDEPVDLVRGDDVDWLLTEYAAEKPALFAFDVIYGMGMRDDNDVRNVVPVLASLKRISAQADWPTGTLAVGHPGHSGERRFRGSSMWRQLAAVEWHMADGSLTCEKSKIANRTKLAEAYQVDYPNVTRLSTAETVAERAGRIEFVQQQRAEQPDLSATEIARRLRDFANVSESTAKRVVRGVLNRENGDE